MRDGTNVKSGWAEAMGYFTHYTFPIRKLSGVAFALSAPRPLAFS